MINIGIGLALPFMWIRIKMAHHIFMHFLLQVYTYRAIASNNFIGAYSSVRRHIAVWVRNADIIGDISHLMMSPFDSRRDKSSNKILM